jgi:hypothetical protein
MNEPAWSRFLAASPPHEFATNRRDVSSIYRALSRAAFRMGREVHPQFLIINTRCRCRKTSTYIGMSVFPTERVKTILYAEDTSGVFLFGTNPCE